MSGWGWGHERCLSLANVKVCTKDHPWPRTCDKGALKLTNLRAARCQASCVGVPTGILLTWGAPARESSGASEDARPLFPGLSPGTSRRPGCGATHLRPLPPGPRALLRPAPTTPNFSLFAPQPSFAERMARQKQGVTEDQLEAAAAPPAGTYRPRQAPEQETAARAAGAAGRTGARYAMCRDAPPRPPRPPRRGAGGGLGGRPRGCEL